MREPRVYEVLEKLIGSRKAEILVNNGVLTGIDAWRALDKLLRSGKARMLYEDEVVDDLECYVAVLRVVSDYLYVLLKIGNATKGYLSRPSDRLVDKAIEEFKKQCLD